MSTVLSPAKINLSLQVIGINSNNYHELNSYFAKLSFGDYLSFSNKSQGIAIKVTGKYKAPNNADNLIFKAAKSLQIYGKTNKGINIILDKQIPMGSGLGGGSSNAATTLLYLNKYWDLNLNTQQLLDLAKSLGADVPFFVNQYQVAKINGIGEIINSINNTDQFLINKFNIDLFKSQINDNYQVLLIIPHYISINTAWAYQLIDKYYQKQFPLSVNNIFSEPIFAIYPDLKFIKNTLQNYGAILADLTGSGSVVFGVFPINHNLTVIKSLLKNKGEIIACKFL